MSFSTRSPMRMAGAQLYSGGPNTGEIAHIRGGALTATIFSGALLSGSTQPIFATPAASPSNGSGQSDVVLFSGPGRLNSILAHTQMTSGLPVIFYDAQVVWSGGPIAASGHRVVGVLPPTFGGGMINLSGGIAVTPFTGAPINVDIPFVNGLAVRVASGQPGWTVTFTPEVAAVGGNP